MSAPHVRVLVAFATRNGSTREVADVVGTVMHDAGAEVEVTPAQSVVGPIHGCDLVVLGAPIYSGRWHREARRFLRRHRDDLSSIPVAVFALGPRRDDEEAWRRGWQQLDRALAAWPWLTPVSVALFGGADPAGRRPRARTDLRDWAAIGVWSRELATATAARTS